MNELLKVISGLDIFVVGIVIYLIKWFYTRQNQISKIANITYDNLKVLSQKIHNDEIVINTKFNNLDTKLIEIEKKLNYILKNNNKNC